MGCTSSKQPIRDKRRKGKQAQIDSNSKTISPTDSEASKQSPTSTELQGTKTPESTTTPVVTNSIFRPGGRYDHDRDSSYSHNDVLTNDVDDDAQDIEQETYMAGNTEGPSGVYTGRRGGVDLTNNAEVNAGKAAAEYGERSTGSGEQNRYLMADQFLELIKDDLPGKKDLPVYEGEEVEQEEEGGMKKVIPKEEELASVQTIAQEMFDDVVRSMGIRTNDDRETITGRVKELS